MFWLNFCSKLPNTRKVASHPRFLNLAIPNRKRARRQGGCWAFGQGNGGTCGDIVGQVTGELLAVIHKPVLMMLISKCDTRFWPVAWCIDVKAQVVASKSPPKEQRCQLTNSLSQNGFKRARYAMSRASKEFGTSAAVACAVNHAVACAGPVGRWRPRCEVLCGPARHPARHGRRRRRWLGRIGRWSVLSLKKKWKVFFVDLWMWVFTPGCKHFFMHLNFVANFYCLVQVILESLTEVRSTEASLKSYSPKTQEQKFTHAGISSSTDWCSTFMSNPICKFKRCDAWECLARWLVW